MRHDSLGRAGNEARETGGGGVFFVSFSAALKMGSLQKDAPVLLGHSGTRAAFCQKLLASLHPISPLVPWGQKSTCWFMTPKTRCSDPFPHSRDPLPHRFTPHLRLALLALLKSSANLSRQCWHSRPPESLCKPSWMFKATWGEKSTGCRPLTPPLILPSHIIIHICEVASHARHLSIRPR